MIALPLAVTVALAWSGAELARGLVLTGFPWALPGHIWTETPLVQTAALIGANGMTAATLLALAAPLAWGRRGLAVPALVLAVAGGWSWHRLSLPEPAAQAARAQASDRYETFVAALGRRLAKGPKLRQEISEDVAPQDE